MNTTQSTPRKRSLVLACSMALSAGATPGTGLPSL